MPDNKIIARVVEQFTTEFYTEGPGLDNLGNLYFTTITGGKIMKLTNEGKLETWTTGGYPNGQRILSNGDHLVCDCKSGSITRFDAEGAFKRIEVHGRIGGRSINMPNDLVIDEGNGFYFTDSIRHDGKVFYVGFNGSKEVVAQDIDYPNGIVLTPDRRTLLVAESYQNRILRIDLKDQGVATGLPEVFATLPDNSRTLDPNDMPHTANLPDGLAFDNQGNLWVAHYGMQALEVINPLGELIATINTGIPATSNLCFSSPDYRHVYVTGGENEPGPGRIHKLLIE